MFLLCDPLAIIIIIAIILKLKIGIILVYVGN